MRTMPLTQARASVCEMELSEAEGCLVDVTSTWVAQPDIETWGIDEQVKTAQGIWPPHKNKMSVSQESLKDSVASGYARHSPGPQILITFGVNFGKAEKAKEVADFGKEITY